MLFHTSICALDSSAHNLVTVLTVLPWLLKQEHVTYGGLRRKWKKKEGKNKTRKSFFSYSSSQAHQHVPS
jgi:hypothetical protein